MAEKIQLLKAIGHLKLACGLWRMASGSILTAASLLNEHLCELSHLIRRVLDRGQ